MKQIRQGDVLLVPVDEIPAEATENLLQDNRAVHRV